MDRGIQTFWHTQALALPEVQQAVDQLKTLAPQ